MIGSEWTQLQDSKDWTLHVVFNGPSPTVGVTNWEALALIWLDSSSKESPSSRINLLCFFLSSGLITVSSEQVCVLNLSTETNKSPLDCFVSGEPSTWTWVLCLEKLICFSICFLLNLTSAAWQMRVLLLDGTGPSFVSFGVHSSHVHITFSFLLFGSMSRQ